MFLSRFQPLKQNKEEIIINKETFKLKDRSKSLIYFATVQSNDGNCERKLNSFKILKFDRVFKNVSRDLLEKFRVVNFTGPEEKQMINSTLISKGFIHNENLVGDLVKVIYAFKAFAKIRKISNGNIPIFFSIDKYI